MSTNDEFLAAVKRNDRPTVERLLAADPTLAAVRDAAGVSALMLALYHGHTDLVALLRERRGDLDPFEAAALGDRKRLAALLDRDGGLGNAVSPDGFPVVTLAAFFGRLEALALLLARGADVAARSDDGQTPLALAEAAGQAAIAALLRERGAA